MAEKIADYIGVWKADEIGMRSDYNTFAIWLTEHPVEKVGHSIDNQGQVSRIYNWMDDLPEISFDMEKERGVLRYKGRLTFSKLSKDSSLYTGTWTDGRNLERGEFMLTRTPGSLDLANFLWLCEEGLLRERIERDVIHLLTLDKDPSSFIDSITKFANLRIQENN